MVGGLLMFGGGGLALLLLGAWGLRRAGQLSAVAGWDEKAREHRRGVLRRGAFACLALGVLFLVIALSALVVPPPPR